MAYEQKDLSKLAGAKSFSLWHYTTPDKMMDIMEQNYFGLSVDRFQVGDIIIANCVTDGPSETRFLRVAAAADHIVVVKIMM